MLSGKIILTQNVLAYDFFIIISVVASISSSSSAFIISRKCGCCNEFGLVRVCVCVCLSVCHPLCLSCSFSNFWKPWPRNVRVCRYVINICRSNLYVKVIGSTSRSQKQTRHSQTSDSAPRSRNAASGSILKVQHSTHCHTAQYGPSWRHP